MGENLIRPFKISEPTEILVQRLGIPLEPNERGIILPPPFRVSGNSVQLVPIDEQALRMALLYFDRIDVPDNQLLSTGLGADADWLEQMGILHRTVIGFLGPVGLSNLSEVLRAAASHLEVSAPGRWSLGGSNRSCLEPQSLVSDRGLIFRLLNSVPVPVEGTPFAEILNFKEARKAELMALRHHLDETYQGILASPDRPLAELTELEALDLAVSNALRVASESRLRFNLSDFRVSLGDLAAGGFSASQTLDLTGSVPLAAVAAFGGTSAASAASLSIGCALKDRNHAGPFEYIVRAHQELR